MPKSQLGGILYIFPPGGKGVVLGRGGGFRWNSCIMGKGWYWGKRWY